MEHSQGTGWRSVLCDSLEKVLPGREPRPLSTEIPLVGFRDEVVSFQVALRAPGRLGTSGPVTVEVDTALPHSVAAVDLVPCTFAALPDHDDGYLTGDPGLFPDVLRPCSTVDAISGQWVSAWVTTTVPSEAASGSYPVEVSARTSDGTVVARHAIDLHVVGVSLPPLSLVNTHWVHLDGLATYYGVEVFSEEHWRTIDNFLGSAAAMSVNSVLTPVWTPPLDTAVGGVRLATQLLDVSMGEDGRYEFGFEKLDRWTALCRRHGMTTLEVSHLFTQWGAKCTPAIYVQDGGRLVQRFGWHVAATDPAYRDFLEQLLPRLRAHLDATWGLEHVLFHVSDEPDETVIDSYAAARGVVDDLLDGCRVADALSHVEFYDRGVVEHPIIATDAAAPFLERGIESPWLYFCVAQHRDVANRYLAMPSARHRAIGSQLFAVGAGGFLHWGFNFYNTQGSTAPVDPFRDTCAGGAFFGGDPFVVYPGPGGVAWPSIRYRVFAEAMGDHRALQLLREVAGDDAVAEVLGDRTSAPLTEYPMDPDYYRALRADVARRVARSVGADPRPVAAG